MAHSPLSAVRSTLVDFAFSGFGGQSLSSLPADLIDDVLSCNLMEDGSRCGVDKANGTTQQATKLKMVGNGGEDLDGSDIEIDVDSVEVAEARSMPSLNAEEVQLPAKGMRRGPSQILCSHCGAELISPCRAVFPQLCPACRLARNGHTIGNRLLLQNPSSRSSRSTSPSRVTLAPSISRAAKLAESAAKEGRQCDMPSPDVNVLTDNRALSRAIDNQTAADSERFYFESDHLALKNNPDYRLLLRSLVVLEAQLYRALKDVDQLHQTEAMAMQDPLTFVGRLQTEPDSLELPRPQPIIDVPEICWDRYNAILMSARGAKLRNTRWSMHGRDEANSSLAVSSEGCASGGASMETFTKARTEQPQASFTDSSRPGEQTSTEVKPRKNFLIRGRAFDESKPATFNQLWTAEEQAKLEMLLEKYPSEPIESRRWRKIAAELGNRTPRQVASRVQKYFIKLGKVQMPIPGRMPNRAHLKAKRANSYPYGNRPSTFFSTMEPRVYMDEDSGSSSSEVSLRRQNSTANAEHSPSVTEIDELSGDEDIDPSLQQTAEYQELLRLKMFKRLKASKGYPHVGYQCDGCSCEPIIGLRWHCLDCPDDDSLDFCSACVDRCNVDSGMHKASHRLQALKPDRLCAVDADYLSSSDSSYLDPNFCPT